MRNAQSGLRKLRPLRVQVIEGTAREVPADDWAARIKRAQPGVNAALDQITPTQRRRPKAAEPVTPILAAREEAEIDEPEMFEPAPEAQPDFQPEIDEPELQEPEGDELDTNVWRFVEHGLFVRASELDWQGMETLWRRAQGLADSGMFFIGDAMNAAEAKFGEMAWQLPTHYRPETIRNAQWVSKSINIARRRTLPFSYHQIVAKLPPEEQDELLDITEERKANGGFFNTDDLKALIKEREEAKRPNFRPEDEDEAGDQDEERYPPEDRDTRERDYDDEDDDFHHDVQLRDPVSRSPDEIAGLREMISEIKDIGMQISEGRHDAMAVRELGERAKAALASGTENLGNPLTNAMLAEEFVPDEFILRITSGRRSPTGLRLWTVTATADSRVALADGPWLPCAMLEAALGIAITEAGHAAKEDEADPVI